MEVKEVLLPGVGLRYEFDNRDGDRIGVIARRNGDFEVVLYAAADPDQARSVFRLTDEEAMRWRRSSARPASWSASPT